MSGKTKFDFDVDDVALNADDEFFVYPYLTKNQIHVMAGSSGAGKTTLLYQILDGLKKGRVDLWPKDAVVHDQPNEILYIASDRTQSSYNTMAKRIGVDRGIFTNVNLVDQKARKLSRTKGKMIGAPDEINLYHWFNWLTDYVDSISSADGITNRIVVFDTALGLLPIRNYNDQRQVMDGMTYAAAWCKLMGATVIATFHTNKLKKEEEHLNIFDRISGSHGLLGYASTKMLLLPENENASGNPKLYMQGQHFSNEEVEYRRGEGGVFGVYDEKEKQKEGLLILDMIPEAPDCIDAGALERAAFAALSISRPTVHRQLQKCIDLGVVKRVGRGRYTREEASQ